MTSDDLGSLRRRLRGIGLRLVRGKGDAAQPASQEVRLAVREALASGDRELQALAYAVLMETPDLAAEFAPTLLGAFRASGDRAALDVLRLVDEPLPSDVINELVERLRTEADWDTIETITALLGRQAGPSADSLVERLSSIVLQVARPETAIIMGAIIDAIASLGDARLDTLARLLRSDEAGAERLLGALYEDELILDRGRSRGSAWVRRAFDGLLDPDEIENVASRQDRWFDERAAGRERRRQ